MKIIVFLLMILPVVTFGLEVDEKLTIRLLRISETKKTVMVNRGTEDGLVEGDHAKFIVTSGIVARAVCVKVSPTRSVWSIYRTVNADFILADSVLTLKITPAIKLTKDETKPLIQDDVPSTMGPNDPQNLGIPLAEGADDLAKLAGDSNDLKSLQDSGPTTIIEKNREIYFIGAISGLSANTKTTVGGQSYSNSQSFYHIGLGGEYYSTREREWYSKWSLIGQLSLIRENSQAYGGSSVANEISEIGLGANFHPFKSPALVGEAIPFFHFAFNFGTLKSSYTPGQEAPAGNIFSANGQLSGYSVGFGYKYYIFKGFGARAIIDYYIRSEQYSEDTNGIEFTKRVAGPRLMLALSYRF
jgi:hypothetical protein